MRSFEERIAEIERRSEKIKRERRQRRKHVLMTCVPLVVIAGMCAGIGFINGDRKSAPPTDIESAGYQEAVGMDENLPEVSIRVQSVQVSGEELVLTFSEPEDIVAIMNCLSPYSYATRAPGSGLTTETAEEDNTVESSVMDSTSSHDEYTITVILEGAGEVNIYSIRGNTLKNHQEEETYTLTEKQLKELKTLLGIAQP